MAGTRIQGIDEALPEGETLIWEGRPDAGALARHAFKIRWIGGYFLGLALLAAVTADPGAPVLPRVAWLLVLGAAVVALARGYAELTARSAVYAVTDRRVVMRVGVAFPAVFNLPFARVGGAVSRIRSDGSGDIAFQVAGSERIGVLYLWPHVRPGRWTHPEPLFRSLPDAAPVAEVVRDALLSAGVGTHPPRDVAPVEYTVLDDDGIVILSNRTPAGTPDRA